MFCVHCGKEIPDTSKFCTYCGKSVVVEQPEGSHQEDPGVSPEDNPNAGDVTEDSGTEIRLKKKKPGWLIPVVAATVLVSAVAVGLIVYANSPEQRYNRQIALGERYLTELNYEEAVAAFQAALDIKATELEDYLGLLTAYAGLDDKAGMKNTYERAQEVIERDFETYDDEKQAVALDILEYVRVVYGDDIDKEIEKTEEIRVLYPDNEDFRGILIDDYFIKGCELVDSKKYEEGIAFLEKALELEPANKAIKVRRDRAVKDYIAYAFDRGEYDLVMELVTKYKGTVEGIDEQFIQDEINEISRIKEEEKQNQSYMKVVYDTMATEDYVQMLAMYNSEDCQDFLQRMTREVYYYFPDDNAARSGNGAACYYTDYGYYFYYGNFEGGSREGYGTTFIGRGGDLYGYFKGNWAGDQPDGPGEEITRATFVNSGTEYSQTINGTLKAGHWDGHVSKIIKSNGYTYDCSFDAVDGVPTQDKTAAWMNATGYTREQRGIPDNYFVYAYCVIDTDAWGSWTGVWSYEEYGEKMGTIGTR